MDTHSESPSPADLAGEAGMLVVGLTTLTIQIFPFALPLIVLTIAPLAVLALAGLVLALPVVVPVWLGRRAVRALRRERRPEPEARPVARHPGGQLTH
jgi:membrane protein implicated in regulation of membrane protease activity